MAVFGNRKAPAKETLLLAVALAIIAVMLVGMTLWSLQATKISSNQTATELSSFYLEEMMGQREQMLEDSLNRNFNYLDRVVELLGKRAPQSQDEARSFLSEMETLYDVDRVGLVDSGNVVYTAHSTFSDASRYSSLQEDLAEPKIVASIVYGAKRQVMLAAPVSGVQLEGSSVVACFIQIDTDDVVGSLKKQTGESTQSTFMGLYLSNGDNLTSSSLGEIDAQTNLISFVESAQLTDDQSVEDVELGFRSGNEGMITFTNNGEKEYIYYVPVSGTDWMLTVLIRNNTIEEQLDQSSNATLNRSIIQLIVTALLIVIIFGVVLLLSKRNATMRARQQELEIRAEDEAALRSAYEDVRRARDEAEAANQAKSTFLFNMSHDIRTPMNAILGFSALMEKELDDPAALSAHLGKVRESGQYLLSLINNVLDMARIESGKMELDEEALDLCAEFRGSTHMFDADVAAKDLNFTVSTNVANRYVYADQSKLRQIAVNLLSNAVKYTPAGGAVRMQLREVSCGKPGFAAYEFCVADTGVGMEKEFQKQIFDLFARERTTTESKVNGTGLGMSIVKRLVDLMGGSIAVDSAPGKGTTFSISLSFKVAPAPEGGTTGQDAGAGARVPLEGKRVLLAEDNDLNAEIAMVVLDEYGMNVERACDGAQCVDMLQQAGPGYYDVVLMDIQMPVMNGYDAARAIRALPDEAKARIPIIAMTANAFEEDRRNAFDAGMNDHVAKPIDVVKLREALSRALG